MEKHVHDPVLGQLTYDAQDEWYASEPLPIPFLGGHICRFIIDGYLHDLQLDEVRNAIRSTLDANSAMLAEAEPYVLQYCNDLLALYDDEDRPAVTINKPGDVWAYVQFGEEFHVSRRADGDSEDGIYLSLECNCDWEVEHGLQLVFRDGRHISKVGSFDGHVTNADAYGSRKLVGVVYKRIR